MGNILFQNNPKPKGNPILDQLTQIRQAGPSNMIFQQMYQSNVVAPNGLRFQDVCNMVKGKTPDQAFRENGLDFNQFKNYKW